MNPDRDFKLDPGDVSDAASVPASPNIPNKIIQRHGRNDH